MKSLLFTLEYPPQVGGVSNYYEQLVKHWPLNESITVLDNKNGRLNSSTYFVFKWRFAFFELWRAVKNFEIEHVIVGQILPLGTVAWLLAKPLGFSYSVILHGMDMPFAIKSLRKRWLTKRILNKANKIVCSNRYVADLASALTDNPDKIEVINPGVVPLPYPNHTVLTDIKHKYRLSGKKIILSIGRLVKRKGVDHVIKQMPNLVGTFDNLVYVIVGHGPDDQYLRNLAASLPEEVRSKIIFTGKIGEAEKWSWLNLCDVFVLPTRDIDGDFEGFGIVYLEANLAGKPVVAGFSGGVPDAVVTEVSGIVVDSHDEEQLFIAIKTLLQDEEYAKKLGQQGRERAISHFNWHDKARKFHQHIKD